MQPRLGVQVGRSPCPPCSVLLLGFSDKMPEEAHPGEEEVETFAV